MSKVLIGFALFAWSSISMAQNCVVLLHGMARSEQSMQKMAEELSKDNYMVVNYGYPSTEHKIETLAQEHIPKALAQCEASATVNFVTHSLGGIIVRQHLSKNKLKKLGRVVMLGPPNKGSEVVDNLKDVPGFEFINGPAGRQLGTEKTSVPNSLGPVNYPVGVVAGSATINPILSQMLPNPDDGKVSVEHTKVEGMADHIVMDVSHPFLMQNDDVILQVKHFLKTGGFVHQLKQAINPEP